MPKYMFQASYTAEGTRGLIKGGGGTARRAAVKQLTEALGVKVEAFYYAFGEYDVCGILDVPDNATMAAIVLAVNASGALQTKTTVLLTPEEVDQACKKNVGFRPPGQ